LKVLHLSAGNIYGGVETFLNALAGFRQLAPEMEPEFGLCFGGRQRDELAATGVALHDLGPVRIRRPWTVRQARERLRRVLARTRPEVVVAHNAWPHVVFAPVVRDADFRLVHFVHGEVRRRNWLERWAARTPPDLVIANSRFTARSAANLFPATPTDVLYLPVMGTEIHERPQVRRRVRQELNTGEAAIVVLIVGRIEPLKGHSVLLDALGKLGGTTEWVCWVVGGAQRPQEVGLEAALKRQAEALGIADRLRFPGTRCDVPAVMAAADIYCQPNVGPEGFGLTIVEALYAGLPVITSNFGGAAEIVDGTCGVLTRPGDPASVAAAMSDLIRDHWRCRSLGAAGPQRAKWLCDPIRQLSAAATLLQREPGRGACSEAREGVFQQHGRLV
jgi:glycosyltransferase involved in cell wall biosynthesis